MKTSKRVEIFFIKTKQAESKRSRMNAAHQAKLFWLRKVDGEMFIER